MELSLQQQQAEEQLRRQCEELQASNQQELQQVQEELARLQQDSKLKLLQAESEKQQVCNGHSWLNFSGTHLVECQDYVFCPPKEVLTQVSSAKIEKGVTILNAFIPF